MRQNVQGRDPPGSRVERHERATDVLQRRIEVEESFLRELQGDEGHQGLRERSRFEHCLSSTGEGSRAPRIPMAYAVAELSGVQCGQ